LGVFSLTAEAILIVLPATFFLRNLRQSTPVRGMATSASSH
jgi:hypothetical protein